MRKQTWDLRRALGRLLLHAPAASEGSGSGACGGEPLHMDEAQELYWQEHRLTGPTRCKEDVNAARGLITGPVLP